MAMSKRSGGEKQEDIWIAHTELAVAPATTTIHMPWRNVNCSTAFFLPLPGV